MELVIRTKGKRTKEKKTKKKVQVEQSMLLVDIPSEGGEETGSDTIYSPHSPDYSPSWDSEETVEWLNEDSSEAY